MFASQSEPPCHRRIWDAMHQTNNRLGCLERMTIAHILSCKYKRTPPCQDRCPPGTEQHRHVNIQNDTDDRNCVVLRKKTPQELNWNWNSFSYNRNWTTSSGKHSKQHGRRKHSETHCIKGCRVCVWGAYSVSCLICWIRFRARFPTTTLPRAFSKTCSDRNASAFFAVFVGGFWLYTGKDAAHSRRASLRVISTSSTTRWPSTTSVREPFGLSSKCGIVWLPADPNISSGSTRRYSSSESTLSSSETNGSYF